MESPGKYLKAEREIQKLSLQEAANFTKIREPLLKTIEEDGYELLPHSLYVKGFLITYARYLGLDPNEVILRYQKYLKDVGICQQKEIRALPAVLSPKKKIRAWLFFALIGVMLLFILFLIYYSQISLL
jgi:cytoskeleton protein RodZ